MKTITFYSYKGGVGRSLALSNIATRLSEIGKKVCIIDFDLDAPGLQFKFGEFECPAIEKGLIDYVYGFAAESVAEKKIKPFSVQLKPLNKAFQSITFIPAGNIHADEYWEKLSLIPWSKLFYSEEGEGIDFFLDLKAKIETEFEPDFLLIDSRTGITDISAITLKIFADEVVVMAANNAENLFGCRRILKNLYDPGQALFGVAPKINFLLTRLPFSDTPEDRKTEILLVEKTKQELMLDLNIEHFDCMTIHSHRSLEIKERNLIGYEYEKGVSIANNYLKLFDVLTAGSLDSDEMIKFNNVKAAEKEFAKGQQATDNLTKINRFTAAINLDDKKGKYYISRGVIYNRIKYWDQAIEDFKKAAKLDNIAEVLALNIAYSYMQKKDFEIALNYLDQNPSLDSIIMKISILVDMGNDTEAMSFINYVLSTFPDNHETLNSRAIVHRNQGNFDLAFKDIYRALELSPKNAVYFGTLAEIYAAEGKLNEFFTNLSVAFSFGLTLDNIATEARIYKQFLDDERFISILENHDFDIEDLKEGFKSYS